MAVSAVWIRVYFLAPSPSEPKGQNAAHRRDALCPSTKIQKQAAFGINHFWESCLPSHFRIRRELAEIGNEPLLLKFREEVAKVLWDRAQSACVAVVLNAVQLLEAFSNESLGNLFSGIDRACLAKHLGEGLGAFAILVEKDLAQFAHVFAGLEHEEDRESELPLLKIRAQRFSGFILIAGKVEDVVVDLVSHTEFGAIGLERPNHCRTRLADEGAEFASGCEEGGRLHLDNAVVVRSAELEVVAALGLDDFSRTNLRGGIRDAAAYIAVAEICGKAKGVGKEAVAEQDRNGVSPFCIRRGLVAAEFRPVHDVIVNKGGDVDEFQNHSQIDVACGDFSRRTRRKEGECGAKAFAACTANIGNIAFDGWVERFGLGTDAFFYGVEVRIDEFKCFGEGNHLGFRFVGILDVIGHRK